MVRKTKKDNEVPEHIRRFRKIYNRYQRNYAIIVSLGLVTVVAVWYFTNHFWGATTLAFGIWSLYWYEEGAQENCVDEWEYAYPKDGFRLMLKSWPWFIGLAAIAYFICKHNMLWLFG